MKSQYEVAISLNHCTSNYGWSQNPPLAVKDIQTNWRCHRHMNTETVGFHTEKSAHKNSYTNYPYL